MLITLLKCHWWAVCTDHLLLPTLAHPEDHLPWCGYRRGCHARPTQRTTYRGLGIVEVTKPDPPRGPPTRVWV